MTQDCSNAVVNANTFVTFQMFYCNFLQVMDNTINNYIPIAVTWWMQQT